MSRSLPLFLVLAVFSLACGDAAHRPIPKGEPAPTVSRPPANGVSQALAPTPAHDPAAGKSGAARPPLELSAAAVEGFPPLPTYRAKVRNVSDRAVRNVVATAVYFDARGLAMPGENQDVQFGSPLKAIEPGVTLETSFLSRVERAPSVRLVLRSVTFLEKGSDGAPAERGWKNPRYEAELADLGAQR